MRPRTVLAVGVIAAALALPAVAPPAAGAVVVRSPPPTASTAATAAGRLGAVWAVRSLEVAPAVRVPGAAAPVRLPAHPLVAVPAVRLPGKVRTVHPLDAAPAAHPAAHPVADTRQPRCGAASTGRFPIGTRLHGGPTVHHPGGGFGQWSVELVNTTDRPCRNIHPVLVFTARDRGLTPARLMLEFYDSAASRWWPAELETTSEGEVVAILDADGAGGLTVPGRAAVAVPVRLALTADTPPNQVTVNAAIVQRRGDDGDWVGESGDYRFAVLDDNGYGATVTRDELATTGNSSLLRLGAALGTVLLFGGVLALAARRLHFPRGRPPGA
ncbi:hypothetical protein [Streptomyces jumonjinensis]|uniref:hypothetical protein n=1 Tax=Streptomyces jumonjinensis TaxID=1945 RepID=UPI0037B25815